MIPKVTHYFWFDPAAKRLSVNERVVVGAESAAGVRVVDLRRPLVG
jgi:hypothetical protein